MGQGHGGGEHVQELSPRLVEALLEKNVVGAAAGNYHTAVWTEAGELFTFGMEAVGIWATEGHRLSLYRGWSRRWSGRR